MIGPTLGGYIDGYRREANFYFIAGRCVLGFCYFDRPRRFIKKKKLLDQIALYPGCFGQNGFGPIIVALSFGAVVFYILGAAPYVGGTFMAFLPKI